MASAHKPGRRDPDTLTATHIHRPGTIMPFRRARIDPLAWAWCDAACQRANAVLSCTLLSALPTRFMLGEAHTAEADHPERDLAAAVEYYLQALYLDAEHPEYGLRHADTSSMLHDAQQSGSVKAVYVSSGGAAASLGLVDLPDETAYRCVAVLRFPKARSQACRSGGSTDHRLRRRKSQTLRSPFGMRFVRQSQRRRVLRRRRHAGLHSHIAPFLAKSSHASLTLQVLIERVRSPAAVARDAPGLPALEVSFQVHFGSRKQLCKEFVARCSQNLAAVFEQSGAAVTSPMGIPDAQTATFALEEVTDSGERPGSSGDAAFANAQRPSSERSVVPARPLKDMELPYKSYRVRRYARPSPAFCLSNSF